MLFQTRMCSSTTIEWCFHLNTGFIERLNIVIENYFYPSFHLNNAASMRRLLVQNINIISLDNHLSRYNHLDFFRLFHWRENLHNFLKFFFRRFYFIDFYLHPRIQYNILNSWNTSGRFVKSLEFRLVQVS